MYYTPLALRALLKPEKFDLPIKAPRPPPKKVSENGVRVHACVLRVCSLLLPLPLLMMYTLLSLSEHILAENTTSRNLELLKHIRYPLLFLNIFWPITGVCFHRVCEH